MSENRINQTRAERRRRDSATLNKVSQKKLDVFVEGQLDTQNYEYHWANDMGNRIPSMTTLDDWDIVNPSEVKGYNPTMFDNSEGSQIRKRVGTHEGQVIEAVLLRKPKDYAEADREELVLERRAQTDKRMRGEVIEGVKGQADGLYVKPENRAATPASGRRSGKI
jgi:hypothetical protein